MRDFNRRNLICPGDLKNEDCLEKIKTFVGLYLLSIILYDKIIYVLFVTMNTRLESLFEKYNLSEKDRYEIRQIYGLLPIEKQKNLLKNFEVLVYRLQRIEEEIGAERKILIWWALDNVKNAIDQVRKEKTLQNTKKGIDFLRQEI